MSDLYLVLRSRLDSVTNWVALGTDVMERARKAKGLSYEAVSRQANVSSKTYERYEKAGRVPEHQVATYADILGLEIERPARERVIIEEPKETEGVVLSLLRDLDRRLRSLEVQVGSLARADDVQAGMASLQAAIDSQAKGRTRATASKL